MFSCQQNEEKKVITYNTQMSAVLFFCGSIQVNLKLVKLLPVTYLISFSFSLSNVRIFII